MRSDPPRASVRIVGHPIVYILASFPIACFTGALVTDITYAETADMMWADFSAWLLAAGMVMGVLAAVAALISAAARRRGLVWSRVWPVALGSLAVLCLAFLNNLVHSRDAWTSVVPLGLAFSAVTVVIVLVTAWFGFGTTYVKVPVTADGRYAGAPS